MNRMASEALFKDEVSRMKPRLLQARSWEIISKNFPILEIEFSSETRGKLRVKLNCQNWNELPPSIALLDEKGELFRSLPSGLPSIFNNSPHPSTGLPFICMVGSLEYHTHSSHISDYWENYRNKDKYTLGGIISQIWGGWIHV